MGLKKGGKHKRLDTEDQDEMENEMVPVSDVEQGENAEDTASITLHVETQDAAVGETGDEVRPFVTPKAATPKAASPKSRSPKAKPPSPKADTPTVSEPVVAVEVDAARAPSETLTVDVSRDANVQSPGDIEAPASDLPPAEGPPSDEGKRKVKFKRAKALHKKASQRYMEIAQSAIVGEKSRFSDWTRRELADLVTAPPLDIPLPREKRIDTDFLRKMCEEVYENQKMPEKPEPVPLKHFFARRIQERWIEYYTNKQVTKQVLEDIVYQNKMNNATDEDVAAIGEAAMMYMDQHHDIELDGSGDAQVEVEIEVEDEEKTAQDDEAGGDVEAGKPMTVRKVSKVKSFVKTKSAIKQAKNILDTEWKEPSIAKAEIYADSVHPRVGGQGKKLFSWQHTTTGRHCCKDFLGEQFDLWDEGRFSEFCIYGPGITNYFKFIKWCFWLFLVLAVISLPSLVLNIYGPNNSNSGLLELAQTTAGNLASTIANSTLSLHIPGCTDYGILPIECTLDKESLAQFYMWLDIIITLVVLFAYIWLKAFEKSEDDELADLTVDASTYTIMLSRLPPSLTEAELVEHFKQAFKRIMRYDDPRIVDVTIANDIGDEIRDCTLRGNIIRDKVRAVNEHRYNATMVNRAVAAGKRSREDGDKAIAASRKKVLENLSGLNEKFKRVEEQIKKYKDRPPRALYAFVTFETVKMKEVALHMYNNRTFYSYLFRSATLKIKGRLPLVDEAPEPSTIIWENLHYTLRNRMGRRLLTTLLTLLLVSVSVVIVFGSKYLQEKAQNNGSDEVNTLCPDSFDTYTEEEKQKYVRDNSALLHCYCDELSTYEQARDSLCADYLKNDIKSQILTYFASFVVLAVNALIEMSLRYFSNYEKHQTADTKGKSVFLRLFLLKYINTSTIFLIDNNNVILKKVLHLTVNSSLDFTADWFNTVGVTIILVQLGDVFAAHYGKIYQWYNFNRNRSLAKRDVTHALTQDELNKRFEGPEFEFAFNYAQLVSTIFVCLTFSTGIPILYLIAVGNFFLFYAVEKYFFVHVYRNPPHFSSGIGRRASSMIPYALMIHLGISMWVLSNTELFSNYVYYDTDAVDTSANGEAFHRKITGKASFPLFAFLLVIVFVKIVNAVIQHIVRVFDLCDGARAVVSKGQAVGKVETFSDACRKRIIKGLTSYHIVHNPVYKEAFGITWKFATENRTIYNVMSMQPKAQDFDEQDDFSVADVRHGLLEFIDMLQKILRSSAGKAGAAKHQKASIYDSFYHKPVSRAMSRVTSKIDK